jgi:hypothetical protein
MFIIPGLVAFDNLKNSIRNRTFRYPSKHEAGYSDGVLIPAITPKFKINPNEKIFTIGSCFAREIEKLLIGRQFNVPVSTFTIPEGGFRHDAPHLLNEYNAGTILQRIENIFGQFNYTDNMGIEEVNGNFLDLFLHIHNEPIGLDTLLARRVRIENLYKQLLECDTIIITLGLTESWFDSLTGCYLNKAPSKKLILNNPDRFYFHRMDVEDVLERMTNAITLINNHSIKKIMLTVSPIPLEATFTTSNAIMANFFSKSVLRVVAEKLYEKFDNVEYFPSYEMAQSSGLPMFHDDNIHVREELVNKITSHMIKTYTEDQADPGHFNTNYIDLEYNNQS